MKTVAHLCGTNKLATTGAQVAFSQLSSFAVWPAVHHADVNRLPAKLVTTTNKSTPVHETTSPAASVPIDHHHHQSNSAKSGDVKSNLSPFSDPSEADPKIGSNLGSHHPHPCINDDEPATGHRIPILSRSPSKVADRSPAAKEMFNHHPKCFIKTPSLICQFILVILLIIFQASSAAAVPSNRTGWPIISKNVDQTTTSSLSTRRTARDERFKKQDQLNFQVVGFRIEGERVEIGSDQITSVYSEHKYTILLYGINFPNTSTDFLLSITPTRAEFGEDCSIYSKDVYNLTLLQDSVAKATIEFDSGDAIKSKHYFICIDYQQRSIHQGSENWMRIHVQNKLLPIWLQIIFICILLCLAGLFSGLNLGLMALDLHELEVIESCGTPTEKKYARRIKPVRKRGNYLLCTILLGNVMVQTTLTVLLEDLTSGLVAVMGSTFSIVVFGEIVPQAICSRQGLAIGANTVFLMWFFMFVTFPISFPVSWTLDRILGKEIGKIYDRDRLTEYLRITQRYNKLDSDELNIIQGALKLKKITVAEVMTKLEDIFSLPAKSVLNFNTLTMIQKSGYSRIPVHDSDRSNIVAVLFAKDLAFVDPDDKIPIQTLCQYYKHEISYIFADATCHTAFTLFKEGKSHMAFVVRVSEESQWDEKDPHYEVLGLVTLEDVLEEVLQTEIVDETDVLTDNRRKKRRKEVQSRIDYAEFCLLNSENTVVSPQMVLVSYQYLSTSVPAFNKRFITENVLRKLINQNVYHKEDPIGCYNDVKICKLYELGKSYDYFILILEGYVVVNVGKENLTFQSGPFTVFGASTLKLQDEDELTLESIDKQINEPFEWISDYTVEVLEKVTYLKLNRKLYLSAVRQSVEEQQSVLPHENNDTSINKSNQLTFNGLKLKFTDKKV